MTSVAVTPTRRVLCRAVVGIPLSASVAWGQLRDFRRFAAQDFFHAAVRVARGGVRQGARLEIDHRFGPFAVTRVGRILQWAEGTGYSFSDLSRRGPRAGFPHVYRYKVTPAGPSRCVIEITIAGLWTARLFPRLLAQLWLRWVFSHIVASVRDELLRYAAFVLGERNRGAASAFEPIIR
jgi:hypothetical protein